MAFEYSKIPLGSDFPARFPASCRYRSPLLPWRTLKDEDGHPAALYLII